ncbi:MAG: exodeoxyribonuclease V subunit gamma, partial [Chloroflexota bacterium]|nr:exodeoxyribonuclease V subunit gamma [Chloroflexota bacterium]
AMADDRSEDGPEQEDAVSVMTVHRAKGLEFRVVFLCGLADGHFPARGRPSVLPLPAELLAPREAGEEDALAEERRLCYVAMTRARDELWLSHSTELSSRRARRRPSQFIAEALDLPAANPQPRSAGRSPLPDPSSSSSTPPPRTGNDSQAALALSFSQVEDYLGCPERYRLRHVVGVPTPPHHALVYGNALHQAVAAFHLRQARGETMSEEALLAVFATHWTAEGFVSRQHEEARYAAGQAALRRFRAARLSEAAAPPAAIERPFKFALGRDVIRGRIDRLDMTPEGAAITDYKSSDVRDRAKADQKARESLQLQVYALAHQADTGDLPAELRLHFLDSDLVGRSKPDPARLERAAARIGEAADGIRAGEFAARPNPIGCGYCPFRQICPQSAA